jgi:hypothetical protein
VAAQAIRELVIAFIICQTPSPPHHHHHHQMPINAHAVAVGEFISVAGQRDAEEADIQKERDEQAKGPESRAHELDELTEIYINRCVPHESQLQLPMTLHFTTSILPPTKTPTRAAV